ncbi:MAG: ABC transporter substrate-binding protein, partial [Anaerolineae bacterium]
MQESAPAGMKVFLRTTKSWQCHCHGGVGAGRRLLLLLVLAALPVLLTVVVLAQEGHQPPTDKPGPAVERLFFKAFDVDRAPLDLAAGEMDIYYYSLKIAAAQELRSRQDMRIFEAPASTLSLLLNPAPAPAGQLNPFSLPQVRRAMQRLIDRDFVAREIYRGQALPMYTHLSPSDFDYLTVYDIAQEMDLGYDPEYARAQIAEAMTEAGAELVDGVWHYQSQPVRLRFIIRVEDERRQLGDLIRSELAEAGFAVDTNYQPFAPAIQTVYSSDPQQFSWHLYTEGWGRGAPQRYDFGTINSMYAPWMGNMPGWREVGFWQYENKRLDELGQQLFRGQFTDVAQRNEIYREMTRLGLDESVRIWMATVLNSFPARADLQGVTEDVAAGPRGIWTLREAYVPGKDELTVGHLWVWTERTTWNPIGGLGDVYSADIWQNLHDPPLWNHPFSGIPEPFRVQYEVETAGPQGKLEVPADAFIWDAQSKAWRPVGEGIKATSKVTFDYTRYFQAPWHHGQPITMADVIYSLYQAFDMSYDPDKARIEVAIAATSRPYLETFRGFRVVDEQHLEVYVDFWHFEPAYIASYASPSGLSMPWELLYAMDQLVFEQRRAAYSDTAAARFNVPWLSLVMDRDARLVRRVLLELRESASLPEAVFRLPVASQEKDLVQPTEAVVRYDAALQWFDQYGHLVISNGPFFLARYDAPAQFAELQAFRHPDYPFKPGDHYRGKPELVQFSETEAGPIALGQAYQASLLLKGPGKLGVRYLLLDEATGKVVQQGEAETAGESPEGARFTVSL